MERARGIEPPSRAWEAHVLPLNHARLTQHRPVAGLDRPGYEGLGAPASRRTRASGSGRPVSVPAPMQDQIAGQDPTFWPTILMRLTGGQSLSSEQGAPGILAIMEGN